MIYSGCPSKQSCQDCDWDVLQAIFHSFKTYPPSLLIICRWFSKPEKLPIVISRSPQNLQVCQQNLKCESAQQRITKHHLGAGFLATRVLPGAIGHSILRTSVKPWPRFILLSNSQDRELVLSSSHFCYPTWILGPSSFQLWKIKFPRFWQRVVCPIPPPGRAV